MAALIPSQLKDALVYVDVLGSVDAKLGGEPGWQGGMRLVLPNVIPLSPDAQGEGPIAWLIANDFGGYDLATENPKQVDHD